MGIYGYDVSSYQPNPPTNADFMFIKATEGTNYVNPYQSSQAAKARRAGMVVGFYHFLHPGNIVAQANYFVQRCVSQVGDVFACDWEQTSSGHASSAEKDLFIRTVQKLRPGHKVLLYCNTSDWLSRDTSGFAGDGLWPANYNGVPGSVPIRSPWLIHQYTSSPLDKNYAPHWANRAAMKAWATSSVAKPAPAPKPAPKPAPAPAKPAAPALAISTEVFHLPMSASIALKSNKDVTLPVVAVAVRDAKGRNHDFKPTTNFKLKANVVTYFTSPPQTLSPGAYTMWVTWKDSAGKWHAISPVQHINI